MVQRISILLVLLLILLGCKESKSKVIDYTDELKHKSTICIEAVFEKDSILGGLRNHASEDLSLSETIINYTDGVKSLDFGNCPEDFKNAFHQHVEAWLNVQQVSDKYPEMRGELHDIFSVLEKSKDSLEFKSLLKEVWETWNLVEQIAK